MINYKYHADGEKPLKHQVFVFGSNRKGIHGTGAALYARENKGALLGHGVGLQGQSYAIPTKYTPYITLEIDEIISYIEEFKTFTFRHPKLEFFVTRIGCGLAGYRDEDIAPWFMGSNTNCIFPVEWELYLSNQRLDELYSLYNT